MESTGPAAGSTVELQAHAEATAAGRAPRAVYLHSGTAGVVMLAVLAEVYAQFTENVCEGHMVSGLVMALKIINRAVKPPASAVGNCHILGPSFEDVGIVGNVVKTEKSQFFWFWIVGSPGYDPESKT